VIIPNGVDIPETLAEKVWIPNGQLRILFISRVDPKKGLEILIDALQLLKDPTISVDVCGSGDPGYIAHLQALVEKYRLGKCVHFLGHVDGENKTRAFGQADICVLPSHSENFGMVIAESLAHGVPVITTRMTPWQELQSHDCGLWIDNQADVLAHAITEIRRRDLAAMGARGREWMRRDFSWGMIAARMQRLYEELASDGIDRTNSISSGGT
jgi:glycosyltransferase involved in cell wall biosynthesis